MLRELDKELKLPAFTIYTALSSLGLIFFILQAVILIMLRAFYLHMLVNRATDIVCIVCLANLHSSIIF